MQRSLSGKIVLFCVTFAIALLALREWNLQPDQHLHIRFFDVGQGDSALITTPGGKTVLIDGGPDWSTLQELGTSLPFFKRRIDLLQLSHPNLDHLVSFPEILRRYEVGGVLLSGVDHSLPRYNEVFALAKKHAVPIVRVSAGNTVDLGDGVTLRILWPPERMPVGFSREANNASVVFMLEYLGKRALFTGDAEKPVEETLVRSHLNLKADLLKVSHHGSLTSSTTAFLKAVSPALAVISVGKNSYGHPRPEVLAALQRVGAEIRRTDEEGTIDIVW